MKYVARSIETVLCKAVRQSPAVIVTGPRQSGKTTLLRRLFLKSHQYVSLDHPDTRLQAIEDPELFLQNHPPPLIIDEIQYAPDIFSWLKIHIDAHRNRAGQFLLTGSQSFPLMAGVTESLAGRISIFTLLSFSIREQMANKKLTLNTLKAMILRGGYPELAVNRKSDARLWFNNYVQTYLERDLRQLVNISNLTDFQRFLELLAALNGQVLNLSTMSRDLGIAVNTVKNWISILEASHQVILIKPYYRNKGKRIVKSPKVYFLDTGLLCFLNGIYYHEQIFKGPSSGQLFEASVLGELIRKFHMEGEIPKIYWWRTNTGEEIDFILERGQKIFPLEIKLTTRSHQGLIKNMASFCKLFKGVIEKGYLINLSSKKSVMNEQIDAVPFYEFLNYPL